VRKKLPSMYHQFMDLADVDITRGPMEVGPTVHYIMGGVRVDPESGASRVPGLYAAGEVSGGMNGANRLGGNSLSDLLVFGRRAGLGAAEYARGLRALPSVSAEELAEGEKEMLAPFQRDGEDPYAVHRDLQETMSTYCGIFRIREDLEICLSRLEELKARAAGCRVTESRLYNPAWHLARDLTNLLVVAEAIARTALLRTESRGAHSRLDFPQPDAELGKVNLSVFRDGSAMRVEPVPLPDMPPELKRLFEQQPVRK
jgi:succinate dehydrogenase / fumarate reductase flavoprotein subunit